MQSHPKVIWESMPDGRRDRAHPLASPGEKGTAGKRLLLLCREWCVPAKTLPRSSKLSNPPSYLHSQHNCFALEVVVHHVPFTSLSQRLDFTSLHFRKAPGLEAHGPWKGRGPCAAISQSHLTSTSSSG